MKLRDLEARLVRQDPGQDVRFSRVDTVAEAHGVDFRCPLPACGHHVRVYFADSGVDPKLEPLPRWRATGTSLDDLTITPSIHLNRDASPPEPGHEDVCRWHGNVTQGDAT